MASIWGADHPSKHSTDTKDTVREIVTQLIISIALGLSAFLGFCFLRPRWKGLYAARKRQTKAASELPDLPDTFFGWIPVVYCITEEEILASAGLDAFVFLSFFKFAIKFLTVTLFFALVVILPVHMHVGNGFLDRSDGGDNKDNGTEATFETSYWKPTVESQQNTTNNSTSPPPLISISTDYLWMYLGFVYFFSGVAIYMIIKETKKIIHIRQDYLGSKSTVTDRTIRISGIPTQLRSEELIKETVENLDIGKVDSVTLCRNWGELDDLITERKLVLRKLEVAWTTHLGYKRSTKPPAPRSQQRSDGDDEESRLLNGNGNDQDHVYAQDRPMTRIWFGFLNLQSRKIDAIDYYEERLRKLDEKIERARDKEFKPTPLAFVTLDSTAAAQMAVQATMDPEPMVLLANPAPAPSDVLWPNTYLSRSSRMSRSWSITAVILLLTIFWSILLVPVAGLLNVEAIRTVWPQLADALDKHPIAKSLINTGLPTLIVSLLNLAVPYLYYYVSTLQGMLSQGEVEMSVISKNFFFTFFNLFIIFTIFGTTSQAKANFKEFQDRLGDSIRDTRTIAFLLANSLQDLAAFYVNLIILQGLGLFPFRLLEFGSVAMYPIYSWLSKTPRDYAELNQPPIFSYGFYLPQTLLIFVICIVYSVLPSSWLVLFFGLIYFMIGSFIYKYQLLYAMDHQQHSTGRAWSIICVRIIVGLIVFQLAVTGILALQGALIRSVLVVPLIATTIWFIVFYRRSYEPLMKFIAIRSLTRDPPFGAVPPGESRYDSETAYGRALDETEETGVRYINPSLNAPLEELWIRDTSNGHGDQADGGQE